MHGSRYAIPDAPCDRAAKTRHWPRRPVSRLSAVVAAAALLASCGQQGILDPQGPIASAQLLLLTNATGIMLVIVVPVILAGVGWSLWYRSSNSRARRRDELTYEGRIDFVSWAIPVLTVALLATVNWISTHDLDPRTPIAANAKPLDVEVVALDWKWLFIYPEEGIASLNQLVIPVGTPLRFRLTSSTVMSSFLIPQLGSQMYAMPGMTTQLNLLADKPGEFPGISANFNGNGFADMRFIAKAVPAADFAGWVAQVRGSGSALDIPAYAALAKPSQAVPPTAWSSVDPNLFGHIIDQTMMGPVTVRAGG
jgi:cytochrome o ubiquinol oxidase subunit II